MSLSNPRRAQAKLIVSLSPGIHLRKLQKLLGTSFSTARYHVEGLERDGEIVRTKDRGHDRLYPAGTSDEMKAVYAVLQSKTAKKVLRAFEEGGELELTNGELSAKLRLPRSTLSECIAELGRVHLVRRTISTDGRVLYEVRDRQEVSRLLASLEAGALSMATEGFIDLWDL